MRSVFCYFFFASVFAFADTRPLLTVANEFFQTCRYNEIKAWLQEALQKAATNKQKAEIYWLLSKADLFMIDEIQPGPDAPALTMALITEGEAYADKAILFDPGNPDGYFWKASHIGKYSKIKSSIESLEKAGEMKTLLLKALELNPEHSPSFFLLGQLYAELPGPPFSFGNIDFAVSLGRRAVSLNQNNFKAGIDAELRPRYAVKLALYLTRRNWPANDRSREQKGKKSKLAAVTDILTKGCYYEATLTLKEQSDKEEALEIINSVIRAIEKNSAPNCILKSCLKEALDLKKKLTKS